MVNRRQSPGGENRMHQWYMNGAEQPDSFGVSAKRSSIRETFKAPTAGISFAPEAFPPLQWQKYLEPRLIGSLSHLDNVIPFRLPTLGSAGHRNSALSVEAEYTQLKWVPAIEVELHSITA
jgi:hypothetical protein